MKQNTLIWFRNDLRIDDNPALLKALGAKSNLALFFRSEAQWRKHHMADMKIDFINRHVQHLKQQLELLGIKLFIIDADSFEAQQTQLQQFVAQHNINEVYANAELELDEVQRDAAICQQGINLQLTEADTIVKKGVILNKDGAMYRVFSAFKRTWLEHVRLAGFEHCELPIPELSIPESSQPSQNPTSTTGASYKWPLADEFIQQALPTFFAEKISNYKVNRDIPSIKGTSGLSPYLAIGAISSRTLLKRLMMQFPDILYDQESSEFSWLNELIWRDFYRHLLFHYPNLIKGQSFNIKYDALQWPETSRKFQLWCNAKTGFPIIDAAMRQLHQSGWMHNRLRMIVASFLTKNLLVNWRLGEQYFMTHLIDGDFAANNGGWQWSAGTGCDAQPYFRVFNPHSQSKKFDPTGQFIRKYLPELANVPDKYIHAPYEYLMKTGQADVYWPEIVDLKSSRLEAIEFYGMK